MDNIKTISKLNGTEWTFSSTICVDPLGDESCDLVEITIMQAPSNPIPVCPLQYITAGPQLRLGGGN